MYSAFTTAELRCLPLFESLDDPTLANVAQRVRRCRFRAGQYIMLEGEAPQGLLVVQQGRVRLSCAAPDGREQVLDVIEAGGMLNLVPLFDGEPTPTTARALSTVECLLLPRDDIFALLSQHPQLARALLATMAGQLRELVDLVEDLAFRSVRARVARHLLATASEAPIRLTQQDLAERVGTVREMAGRVLRRFSDEGAIKLERGKVQVLDVAALNAASEA